MVLVALLCVRECVAARVGRCKKPTEGKKAKKNNGKNNKAPFFSAQ
jgi:hypothetical protein